MTLHPRTKKKFEELDIKFDPHVRFCEPFNFSDYIKLQENATCVISDSGTISEESALLGFPAVTIRNAIERPEAIDAGVLTMTGTNPLDIMTAISLAQPPTHIPDEYLVDNCSQRVLNVVLSFTPFVNRYVWQK
jgi:UDP-N-acetylglucosamine 2-epimerase (non-hydrolysing)